MATQPAFVARLRRIASKPPAFILERLLQEGQARVEKYLAPARGRRFTGPVVAAACGFADIGALWRHLAARTYLSPECDPAALAAQLPAERERVVGEAEEAMAMRIDLLGSGPLDLSPRIDWHRDHKTGTVWQPAYCRAIQYNNLDQPSDVKVPWEVSRMQWLMPVAQAYQLTGDDRYAAKVRELLEDWIAANPYAFSVNWACTMDVALRAIEWTYFFHAFKNAPSWRDETFRSRFLAALYGHGDFTLRHLEKSDVNGNHYTADACGLVVVGLFFGCGGQPNQWAQTGWDILSSEIELQVFPDGVDFEASVPYHRLVQELFLYPALHRLRLGLPVAERYRERLLAMARFTATYSRPDGSVPLWGDADDARTLPFRRLPINDHRYLVGVAGIALGSDEIASYASGPREEIAWLLGPEAARALDQGAVIAPGSRAFPDGGFYVMRGDRNQVFVDCGPLGLADRGGHGHNDLLSFDAMLDGKLLVTDCGAYLYTANYRERNAFRSTAYHNTPQVDGEEINRFIRPDYLWFLHNDARFAVTRFETSAGRDVFEGSHSGYKRLSDPVSVSRSIILHHAESRLEIRDAFEGNGEHTLSIPLHLALGVTVMRESDDIVLQAGDKRFTVAWSDPADWSLDVGEGRVSPTYGVAERIVRLAWSRRGPLRPLTVVIAPRGA